MGRADEYERTLLRAAELLEAENDPAQIARMCRAVVDGMNLEAADGWSRVAHLFEETSA